MPAPALLPDHLRLPDATVGVGPVGWLDGRGSQGADLPVVPSLREMRTRLVSDEPSATIVVLHGPHLDARGELSRLAAWLRGVTAQNAEAVVVLVGAELSGPQCAALIRAGLFDCVPPAAPLRLWREVKTRMLRRLERDLASRAVSRDAEPALRLLRDQRRRLREDVAGEAEALWRAQQDLEAANRQLAGHMEQLSLLYRLGRELSSAPNWDETLRGLLEHLSSFVGAVGAAVVLRSAPGGSYAPRQTYRWDESAWDKVLLNLSRQIDGEVAESLLAPGIFAVAREGQSAAGRIMALPLEHQDVRLGYLLLLYGSSDERQRATARNLSFLQMVQVVLSEEVAGAQMLDRLREISAFNAQVIETVRAAIWVCDASGRTIYANRAVRELLGLPAAPVVEDPHEVFTIGRGRAGMAAENGVDVPEVFQAGLLLLDDIEGDAFAALYARETVFQGTGRVTAAGGIAVPVQVHAAAMPGRGRKERWLLVVAEDLREAHRAEAARRRAERLEGLVEMSTTLAHEIRNPLMGLSAQAELLAEHLPASDPRKRYLDVITGEVERIEQTITRMLQFVRPYVPQRQASDVAALVRDCIELSRPRAAAANVELRAGDDGPQTALIDVDPVQIKQVLLNLVINAIDASPAGGHVRVSLHDDPRLVIAEAHTGTQRVGPGLVIDVEDDGPGFGDVAIETLFRPFFTTKSTGTGLGLAISQKVVTAHGGQIHAERIGEVTRMRVLLPRQNTTSARALVEEAT